MACWSSAATSLGSALQSACLEFSATTSSASFGNAHLVGCWSGLSVQSGVVIGVAAGFGPSGYVVLKGSVVASLLVSGLLVGSGVDLGAASCLAFLPCETSGLVHATPVSFSCCHLACSSLDGAYSGGSCTLGVVG